MSQTYTSHAKSECADKAFGNHNDSYSTSNILGYCHTGNQSSLRYGCDSDNGQLYQYTYANNQCNGDPFAIRITYDGGCEYGQQIGIICGTAIPTTGTCPPTTTEEPSSPSATSPRFMMINYISYLLMEIFVYFL